MTVTLRSVQAAQAFFVAMGILVAIGTIIGGAILIGGGTGGGLFLLLAGVLLVVWLAVFARGAARVDAVMGDALSAELDSILAAQ